MAPSELPEPYRSLLVHSADMTPTLESHFRQRAGLRVLRHHRDDGSYWREVVLTVAGDQAVEYGIIQIHLDWYSPPLREQILQEKLPLGRLLQDHAIPHLCWPQGFYKFEAHRYLQTVLGLDHAVKLYARRNVILNSERRLIADVLEMLSPRAELFPLITRNPHKLPADKSDFGPKTSC